MNINGHGLQDHIRLAAPLFGVIAAVWALRLILAAAGAPRGLVLTASVTIAHAFCILVVAVLIHVRRFRSPPISMRTPVLTVPALRRTRLRIPPSFSMRRLII